MGECSESKESAQVGRMQSIGPYSMFLCIIISLSLVEPTHYPTYTESGSCLLVQSCHSHKSNYGVNFWVILSMRYLHNIYIFLSIICILMDMTSTPTCPRMLHVLDPAVQIAYVSKRSFLCTLIKWRSCCGPGESAQPRQMQWRKNSGSRTLFIREYECPYNFMGKPHHTWGSTHPRPLKTSGFRPLDLVGVDAFTQEMEFLQVWSQSLLV